MPQPPTSLVYVSRASPSLKALSPEALSEQLGELQAFAFQHNRDAGICGFLVHVAGYFVQWLEGEARAVDGLFKRIAADPRHTQVRLVYQGAATGLLTEWSMSLMSPSKVDPGAQSYLAQCLDRKAQPEPVTSPTTLIRHILQPQAADQPGSGLRRVGLFGQTTLWTSALLAHLSQQWQRPVSRTRLMQGAGFDEQAVLEHLDAQTPGQGALRVMNYSGEIVTTDVMHVLIESLDVAVLFMSQASLDDQQAFFERCMLQLGPVSQPVVVLCVFSRTSVRHMPDIQALGEKMGRPVQSVEALLADSEALWQVIADALDQWAPKRREPPRRVTAPAETESLAPEPTPKRPLDASPLPDTGRQAVAKWLRSVMAIEGLAGAAVFQPGPSAWVLCAEQLAPQWAGASAPEQMQRQQRLQAVAQASGKGSWAVDGGPQQWLMHTENRLLLALPLGDSRGLVLAVESERGRVNEALLLAALKRCLLKQPA